ncbi:Large neutral amino acids transporter small subunit 2 [Orchesella cincta]|uniref:Large neutral amino acids transporter small subunit 2 n=1 Tax=Orchesella cincta TaxID=48709 RepID=A0A1D2N6K6_ORCCI|nr:Large neutral amino acids transporter small subunit 2 [Orchesella cincta]
MTIMEKLHLNGKAPSVKSFSNLSPDGGSSHHDIRMKKELGLLEGVAIILGIIIGSGIFISPKGVVEEAHSVGLTLVIWSMTGVLSMIGAVCYAELGTTIPKSGGDYAYIYEAFGPLPAFLFLWDANVVFVPTTNAIMGLTFANYVVQPFFPAGCLPEYAIRMIAASAICFLTFLNCYDVRITTRMQNLFLIAKIGGLATVIIAGMVHLLNGNTENFREPFANSQTDYKNIALSFYSGIFSYAGWNYLNFMTEELKDPYKNLPRAIYISLPLATGIYVLANIGYMAVLTPAEILATDAIAVTFGDKVLGALSWIMPCFVALSTFGGLSVHIMTSSRLLFVGARQGHFPQMLSTINSKRLTPAPALAFLCFLSLFYLETTDIIGLIVYSSFVESSFIFITVLGMLYLRWKKPYLERPIKVHIILPIIFLLICGFLVVVPCFVRPIELGVGILITITGIPFYVIFIWWHPHFLSRLTTSTTEVVQKTFLSLKED